MDLRIEISKVENGTYGPEEKSHFTRVSGYGTNGRWHQCIAYDPVARPMLADIEKLLGKDEDIASRKIIVELKGEWRNRQREGRKDQWSFKVDAYKILSGPSLENERVRRESDVALVASNAMYVAGEVEAAYLRLEELVAAIARRPRPSMKAAVVEGPDVAAGPEEAAMRRMRERRGQDMAVVPAPDVAPSPTVATAREVVTPDVDLPEAHETDAATAADLPSSAASVAEDTVPYEAEVVRGAASVDSPVDDTQVFGEEEPSGAPSVVTSEAGPEVPVVSVAEPAPAAVEPAVASGPAVAEAPEPARAPVVAPPSPQAVQAPAASPARPAGLPRLATRRPMRPVPGPPPVRSL